MILQVIKVLLSYILIQNRIGKRRKSFELGGDGVRVQFCIP